MVTDQGIVALDLRTSSRHDQTLMDIIQKRAFYDSIRQSGIDLNFLNPPNNALQQLVPVSGRDHLKGVAIDDRAFYFGKVNYDNYTASCADYVIKFTDYRAQVLSQVFDQV